MASNSRGKNYTEREKCSLLSIIDRYKSIIENKSTNAVNIIKKNEAWEKITASYNSSAEVPRTQKQLQTVYLNLKRVTRKTVADENVKQYIIRKNEIHNSTMETVMENNNTNNDYDENVIKKLKKDQTTDKKQIKATGGGTYKPLLNDAGTQILALIGSQVKPLTNSCDSASEYYVTETTEQSEVDISPDCYLIETNTREHNDRARSPEIISPTRKKATDSSRRLHATSILKTKKQQIRKSDMMKQQYYKKKVEIAAIEKKIKLVEFKSALRKKSILNLDFKIKKIEHDNLLKMSQGL